MIGTLIEKLIDYFQWSNWLKLADTLFLFVGAHDDELPRAAQKRLYKWKISGIKQTLHGGMSANPTSNDKAILNEQYIILFHKCVRIGNHWHIFLYVLMENIWSHESGCIIELNLGFRLREASR
jgi:hypothetical protein